MLTGYHQGVKGANTRCAIRRDDDRDFCRYHDVIHAAVPCYLLGTNVFGSVITILIWWPALHTIARTCLQENQITTTDLA